MEEDEVVMKIIFDEIDKTKTIRNSAEIDKEIKKEDKNMGKIEIGKKYRLTGNFNSHCTMNRFKNNEMVKVVGEDNTEPKWKVTKLDEDFSGYCDSKCLKPFKYTFEDFRKAPIGTKVFFEDGKCLVKCFDSQNIEKDVFQSETTYRSYHDLRNMRDNLEVYGKIIKIEEPAKCEIIYESKAILDEEEKKYLGDFIRPFRGKVDRIRKTKSGIGSECLTIYMRSSDSHIYLPHFKTNTMYKGMRDMQDYTPEELGI